MMEALVILCGVSVMILLGIGNFMFAPWADRRRVHRLIENSGGTVLKTERHFPARISAAMMRPNTVTYWLIHYRDASGKTHIAECSASSLHCTINKDRIVGEECMKCGYNLTGNISGVCPECGRQILDS